MYKKITILLTAVLVIAISLFSFSLYILRHDVENNIQQGVNKSVGTSAISPAIIKKAKRTTVIVKVNSLLSAYDEEGTREAIGFIIDKAKGLIVTNANGVGRATKGNYKVKFYNGRCVEAKVLFCDPWADYAFLQIKPQDIPKKAEEAKLSSKSAEENQDIFMVGNNNGLFTCMGTIIQLNQITTVGSSRLPMGTILYKLNSEKGIFGIAGIFNKKGEILALHVGIHKTSMSRYGLYIDYIKYALPFIQQGKNPPRKHIGTIISYTLLDEVAKYVKIPNTEIEAYREKFPNAFNRILCVGGIIKGTPAEGILQPGDIIKAVNGEEIGPELIKLDLAMNQAKTPSISLQIYREGKLMDVSVGLYDLHNITRMVYFGGAVFFETDSVWSNNIDVPIGTLTFYKIEEGKSFGIANFFQYSKCFNGQIIQLAGKPVSTLDDIIDIIPKLKEQKHFSINYTDIHKKNRLGGISYNESDPSPKVFTFNKKTLTWEVTTI